MGENRHLTECLSAKVLLCWAFPEVGKPGRGGGARGGAETVRPSCLGRVVGLVSSPNAVSRQAPPCGWHRGSWHVVLGAHGQHWSPTVRCCALEVTRWGPSSLSQTTEIRMFISQILLLNDHLRHTQESINHLI